MKNRVIIATVITAIHFAITTLFVLTEFSIGMARFDTGAANPSFLEIILHIFTNILIWPFYAPLHKWFHSFLISWFPGLLGYLPLLINSSIWGIIITVIIKNISKR